MGANFSNLQVFIGRNNPEYVRNKIIEIVRAEFIRSGFIEVNDRKSAEWSIAVGPNEGTKWISVYDGLPETGPQLKLQELGCILSKSIEGFAIGILNFDSDLLYLQLYKSGTCIDNYYSNPIFAGGNSVERKSAYGNPELWKELLCDGHSSRELRKIFRIKYEIASEERLEALEPLLGWEMQDVSSRFDDIVDSIDFQKLHFKLDGTRTYKVGGSASTFLKNLAKKTDDFTKSIYNTGENFQIHDQIINEGTQGTGIKVKITGSALAEMVSVKSISIGKGLANNSNTKISEVSNPERGGKEYSAEFANIEILPRIIIENYAKHFSAFCRLGLQGLAVNRIIDLSVFCRAVMPGTGELNTEISVLSDDGKTCLVEKKIIDIRKTYNPLHGLKDSFSPPSQLQVLSSEKIKLFGFIVFDNAWANCEQEVNGALELWRETVLESVERKTLRLKTVKGRAAYRIEAKFNGEGNNSFRSIGGCSITNDEDSYSQSPVQEVPIFNFWIAAQSVSKDSLENVRNIAIEILDNLMVRANGIQAMLGQWDWEPGGTADTPYENACGIWGKETAYLGYCGNYLKGVTRDTIWLGRALSEKISNFSDIRRIAAVTLLANAVRIALKDPEKVNELEQYLEPLLSRQSDFDSFKKMFDDP